MNMSTNVPIKLFFTNTSRTFWIRGIPTISQIHPSHPFSVIAVPNSMYNMSYNNMILVLNSCMKTNNTLTPAVCLVICYTITLSVRAPVVKIPNSALPFWIIIDNLYCGLPRAEVCF